MSKMRAFALEIVAKYKDQLIAKDAPLESGKMVLVESDGYCSESTKAFRKEVFGAVRAMGIEVVKPDEIFDGMCWYKDERLERLIEDGIVYHALDIFSYESVREEHRYYYFKGRRQDESSGSNSTSVATSPQSVEAMRLVQQVARAKQNAVETIAKKGRELAADTELQDKGELTDAEKEAFDIILFTRLGGEMLKGYGHTRFGKPYDEKYIEVAKQHQSDHNLWIREYIRTVIASADAETNPLYQHCAQLVLSEWQPGKHKELVTSVTRKFEKKSHRLEDKLWALGYDIHGHLLERAITSENITLVREGDYYEVYGEDAEAVSKFLGISLSKVKRRGEEVKLAGFHKYALDTYLSKFIRAGIKVVINDPEK